MTELFHISKHDKTRLVGPDWYADVTSLCYTSYAPCMSQEDLQDYTAYASTTNKFDEIVGDIDKFLHSVVLDTELRREE